MAGNVVVKINPDRPWIVVSPRNVAVYYTTSFPFVSSTNRTFNYVLTESKKNLLEICDIVSPNLVIIVCHKMCNPLNKIFKIYNFLFHVH